jgi:hypothetical protein
LIHLIINLQHIVGVIKEIELMYESSNYSYVSVKFVPLIIGIMFLTVAFWIMIGPFFEITVNGVKRKAIFSDSYLPLSFGLLTVLFYLTIGQRIVKMKISNNEIEFSVKGEKIRKNWGEVENIKKYWFVAPPFYSVRFENVGRTYFFTTRFLCIVVPFYVFDISEMGSFIKRKKQNIPFLKELENASINEKD